jgi:hypothetical protein
MSPVDPLSRLAVEALNAARRWVQARLLLKRTLDSKAASPQHVDKCKTAYNKAAEELEAIIVKLERALHANGKTVPLKRGAGEAPFPWRELFGMVAAGAKAVETALDPVAPKTVAAKVVGKVKVIDVKAET